jgi:hypothetical protein
MAEQYFNARRTRVARQDAFTSRDPFLWAHDVSQNLGLRLEPSVFDFKTKSNCGDPAYRSPILRFSDAAGTVIFL